MVKSLGHLGEVLMAQLGLGPGGGLETWRSEDGLSCEKLGENGGELLANMWKNGGTMEGNMNLR